MTVTVKELVLKMTITSQEIPPAAWTMLLSQRQEFLNNLLAQIQVTPNCRGAHEMRHEVLLSVGSQDMDTSECQVSDLDNIQFYWKNDQLYVDAVFRPGSDTPFSPTAFDKLEMGGFRGIFLLLDEEEDKQDSPPTTPVSGRPTRPPALLKSRPFGKRMENVPDYVLRILFQKVLPSTCFIIIYKYRVSFYHNFFQKLVKNVRQKKLYFQYQKIYW